MHRQIQVKGPNLNLKRKESLGVCFAKTTQIITKYLYLNNPAVLQSSILLPIAALV